MMRRVYELAALVGLNQAVFVTLTARVWQVLSGLLTVLLIAHWFTKEEQGYFYTFSSVLGLQVVFEMGLSFVILQFSGHLFSNLTWGNDGVVLGPEQSVKKFHMLLSEAFIWYRYAAVAMIVILLPVGVYFFYMQPVLDTKRWLLPWVFLVSLTALNLVITAILSAIEGSGRVAIVNKLRLLQSVVGSLGAWLLLVGGFGLWMVVSIPAFSFIISLCWIAKYYPAILHVLTSNLHPDNRVFSWRSEVWPMQWRIAVSWISGYFIFQLFTPILFHFYGPVSAGKMGMSLALATMINSFGFVWLQANAPVFTKLAAQENWVQFDALFFRAFRQSLIVVLLGSCIAGFGLVALKGLPIVERILPLLEMSILMTAFFISHVVSGLAYYLRLHKQEPFMLLSLIGAVILSISIFQFGRLYAEIGIVTAFLCVNLIYGLPSAFWLWAKKRREWH